jgi:hypothetical protein
MSALHELGKPGWEVPCWWHDWQKVIKELTPAEAFKLHYERSIRYKQDSLF